jgi:hypothetical protein
VIDISDPTSPTYAGSYDTPGEARGVAISGDYAYVTDREAGLQVIDISDPTSPTYAGSYDTPDSALGVAISGDYAYVADRDSGLRVIYIAEPVLPPELAGSCDTAGFSFDVAVAGDYAYVADFAVADPGLKVIDITDPTNPVLVGSWDAPDRPRGVAVAGDYAYVAGGYPGLHIIDISDPTSPTLLGTCDMYFAQGVAVAGDYAFVASENQGLTVVDVSDPTNPTIAGSYNPGPNTQNVWIAGDYAYLANGGGGFKVIDISDPTNPTLAGGISTPDRAYDVAVAGNYAYVADEHSGLQVIDITDPTNPAIVGAYDTPDAATGVAISGDHAYVADGHSGVLAFDITNPTNPILIGAVDTPYNARRIAIAGDYAYVADEGSGLQVIQVFQRAMNLADNVGQSIDVSPYADDILEVRLATVQSDTVTWEMSGDGGSNWQAVLPDGSWDQLAYSGNDFRWRSTHVPVNMRTNPTCSSLQFDFMFEFSQIYVIEDIPNDQGHQVRIRWVRSGNDYVGSSTPITEYAIYRKIDGDLLISSRATPEVKKLGLLRLYPPGDWDFIMTAPARAEDEYSVVVPTLADSTISEGMYYSTFFVSALTDTPGVYFDSPPDSGYSVDNLAPAPPPNFRMTSPTDVAWDESQEEDFNYFTVYGSAASELDETATLIGHTIGTGMDVTGDQYDYYHVTATDFSGNEGEASSVGNTYAGIRDTKDLPTVFALGQSQPNPFDAGTVIKFDVPKPGALSIKIYDAEGRLVKLLAQGTAEPGRYSVTWAGDDQGGNPASPGIYFVKMKAAGFSATRKATLLR